MLIIEALIRNTVPEKQRRVMERYKRQAFSLKYYGQRYVCPICGGQFRKLLPFGHNTRTNAQCPKCGLLERHRLLWLYLKNRTDFFTANLKVLDIAPCDFLQCRFRAMSNLAYTSIDLGSPVAMLRMDITDLQFSDNSFDCIICYHVLEHVTDDIKAMKEIHRVLEPHGWAIIQVPILKHQTVDGADITNPEERAKMFGQPDHVRVYGPDYKDRLESVGFTVTVDEYVKQIDVKEVDRYRLDEKEDIYVCRKS